MTKARDLADYIATGVSGTELDILDGLTTTTAELNIMDGVTATTAELNILDGVTSTAAELNILDGVTSTAAELNILDGVTASAAELNYNDITTLGTVQASKVVTADANGDVLFPDDAKASFGASSDLKIFHDGSDSYIHDSGVGNLNIKTNVFRVNNAGGTEIMANFVQNGAVSLYYDNSVKVATTTSGVSVTGNVISSGTIGPGGDTAAGDDAAVGYTAAEGLILTGQGSTNDVTIKNDADADVIEIPTGTTSVTMTGSLKPLTYHETYVSKSAASTVTCDLATGTHFSVTVGANTTFAFSNPPSSGTSYSFLLIITQHSTAVTLTWPSTVDWAGGAAPAVAGNNEVQAYGFVTRDGGTTYYGFLGGTAIG